MDTEKLFIKINSEFRDAAKAKAEIETDSVAHLSELQKKAWAQILSSAATSEGEERDLIRPLVHAFKSSDLVSEYIVLQAADEDRHAQLLRQYVKSSFDYEKKKASISDVVLYQGIFPRLGKLGIRRPLPFIGALYYYELFAEVLYSCLRERAEVCQLPNLAKICEGIQKDELRHAAGVKNFINYWREEHAQVSALDIYLTKFLFSLISADVNTHYWALHNRHVRENMLIIGINPDEIYKQARGFAKKAYEKITQGQVLH